MYIGVCVCAHVHVSNHKSSSVCTEWNRLICICVRTYFVKNHTDERVQEIKLQPYLPEGALGTSQPCVLPGSLGVCKRWPEQSRKRYKEEREVDFDWKNARKRVRFAPSTTQTPTAIKAYELCQV